MVRGTHPTELPSCGLLGSFQKNFGTTISDSDERFSGAAWLAAALFPILQGAYRNAKQFCKGGLRQAGFHPGRDDRRYSYLVDFPGASSLHLAYGFQQFSTEVAFRVAFLQFFFCHGHAISSFTVFNI